METPKELHLKASFHMQNAIALETQGKHNPAREQYILAFENEKKAAMCLFAKFDKEPTRGILFRSAANLAISCSLLEEAEQMAAAGLAGNPFEETKDELREILEGLQFKHHLKLRGEKLSPIEIQISFIGEDVIQGMISSDKLINKLKAFENLLLRSAERKLNKPYRRIGSLPAEIKDNFSMFVSPARRGSFTLSLRVGQNLNEQTTLFDKTSVSPREVLEDVIQNLRLVNDDKEEILMQDFGNEAYYQNFISLAKTFAPDGQSIKQVGLTIIRNNEEIQVGLVKKQKQFILPPNDLMADYQAPEKIKGKLTMGDSALTVIRIEAQEINSVKLQNNKNIRITAPEGLADVVKLNFDSEVIAVVRKDARTNKYHLMEILS